MNLLLVLGLVGAFAVVLGLTALVIRALEGKR